MFKKRHDVLLDVVWSVLKRNDQRQSAFVFAQVVALWFACDGSRVVVENVVADLESHAKIESEGVGVIQRFAVCRGENCSGFAAGSQKDSRFTLYDLEVRRLVAIEVVGLLKLEQFPFAHLDDGEVDEVSDALVVNFVDGTHYLSQVEIASQDSGFVVPKAVYRGDATSSVGFVDHIIVNQSAAVKSLDGGGNFENGVVLRYIVRQAAAKSREQGEHRADLFAVLAFEMPVDAVDDRDIACRNGIVGRFEVRVDRRNQVFYECQIHAVGSCSCTA